MKKFVLVAGLLLIASNGWAEECVGNPKSWHDCVGTLTYSNGSNYVGEFKDGKKHGQGTFTYVDGRTRTGTWFANKYLEARRQSEFSSKEYLLINCLPRLPPQPSENIVCAEEDRLKAEAEQKIKREKQQQKYREQRKIEREREAEELRLAALEKKKSLCREIGAEDESSEMVLCVTRLMEIDKMSEIAEEQKQQAIDDRTKILNEMALVKQRREKDYQAQANLLRQQQADAKRQKEAQFLMNMGAMIGGYGTSSSSSKSKIDSTPTLPQYPQHSFTRNVQYNQNCPILTGTYKVKEETIGTNKICYYK